MQRKTTNCQACTRRNTKRMVSCCHCNTWWHYECAGVNDSIADDDRTFTCPTCQKPSSWMPYEATPNPSERGSELGSKVGSTSGKSTVSSKSRRAQLELERLTALRELEQKRLDLDELLELERLTMVREVERKRLDLDEQVLEATFRVREAELEDEEDNQSVSTEQSNFVKITEWQKRQQQYDDVNSTMIPVSEAKTSTSGGTRGTVTQPGQGGVTHQPGSFLGNPGNARETVGANVSPQPPPLWSWPPASGPTSGAPASGSVPSVALAKEPPVSEPLVPSIPALWSCPSATGTSTTAVIAPGLVPSGAPASGPLSTLPPATWPPVSDSSAPGALAAGLSSQQTSGQPSQLPPATWPSTSGSSTSGALGAGLPSQQQPASGSTSLSPPATYPSTTGSWSATTWPPATWPSTTGSSVPGVQGAGLSSQHQPAAFWALGSGLLSQQPPASGPPSQPPPATRPLVPGRPAPRPPFQQPPTGPPASGPWQLPPASGTSATGAPAPRPPPPLPSTSGSPASWPPSQQIPASWPPAPYPPSVPLPGQQLPAQWPPTSQPPTQLPSVTGPSVQWPPSLQLPASLPLQYTEPGSQIPVAEQPTYVGPTKLQIQARLVVPKELPIFKGRPEDWPAFISAYKYSTEACGFSDIENLGRLQKYVQGDARLHVESMLRRPGGVAHAMAQLEQLYGRPEILVHTLLRQIRDAAAPKENDPSSLVTFGLTVQNLCNYIIDAGQEAHLNNPELLVTLVGKLPTRWMMDWSMYQERCAVVNLTTFSQYMQVLVRAGIHASLYKEMTPTRQQSPQQT